MSPQRGFPGPPGAGEEQEGCPLPSTTGHLVGHLRLTLEATCSPLIRTSFKSGTSWSVCSAFEMFT